MQAFAFGRLPENTVLYAQELKAKALKCRTYGHAWDEDGSDGTQFGQTRDGKTFLKIYCPRCTTHAKAIFNGDFSRSRRYDYAEGYAREKGSGRITAQDIKALWMVHLENCRAAEKKNAKKRGRTR